MDWFAWFKKPVIPIQSSLFTVDNFWKDLGHLTTLKLAPTLVLESTVIARETGIFTFRVKSIHIVACHLPRGSNVRWREDIGGGLKARRYAQQSYTQWIYLNTLKRIHYWTGSQQYIPINPVSMNPRLLCDLYEHWICRVHPLTCIENLAHPKGSGLHIQGSIQEFFYKGLKCKDVGSYSTCPKYPLLIGTLIR